MSTCREIVVFVFTALHYIALKCVACYGLFVSELKLSRNLFPLYCIYSKENFVPHFKEIK